MKPHKQLLVWQKSMDLVVEIYKITELFPMEEKFALTSQIRRAAISVPSNISEGLARNTNKDKIHFLIISKSSLSELDTQLELSERLKFLSDEKFEYINLLLTEVDKLLSGLINKIKKDN